MKKTQPRKMKDMRIDNLICKQLRAGAKVFVNKEKLCGGEIDESSMMEEYDKNMGGIDLMDESTNRRRTAIHGKMLL